MIAYNKKELDELCIDIRKFLIENLSKTGGHLASNLGAIELTVALHYVFDSPKDKFILKDLIIDYEKRNIII